MSNDKVSGLSENPQVPRPPLPPQAADQAEIASGSGSVSAADEDSENPQPPRPPLPPGQS